MRKIFVAAAFCAALVSAPATSLAQTLQPQQPPRVALFLVDGMSFEQFMAVPEFRSLARAGGAALMSPRTVPGDEGPGAYVTLGAGARSEVRFPMVPVSLVGRGLHVGRWRTVVHDNLHRSVPGLLASVLESRGLGACADTGRAALVAAARSGRALEDPRPLSPVSNPPCALAVFTIHVRSAKDAGPSVRAIVRLVSPGRRPVRVIVLEARPSTGMLARHDELTPIVMAEGTPSSLFSRHGPMHSLTSDTTRLDGVVSNEDVAPTILSFFHVAVPSDMNGAVIRTIDDRPPFDLHRRHLEQRRLRVPVDVGIGIGVFLIGVLMILIVARRPSLPRPFAARAGALPLMMAAVGLAPLAGGGLPSITYGWVVPFLVVVPAAAAFLFLPLRRRGSLVPAVAIGTAILAFFAVEAIEGWPDMLSTLFGGTALDGARFYGMGNVDVGLLLGAALWVAAALPPYEGFVLLVATGLFAGFPDLGVNFGAAITIFAAAGMWLAIRTRRRLGAKEWLFVAAIIVAGLVVVVGANLVWAKHPTHGTHFVHNVPARGVGGLYRFAVDRLLVGWRLLADSPMTALPVLGLVPLLYTVLRPTPPLERAFRRYPSWRDAMLVLILSSMVAYVANDSGPAAAGWGFGLALAGIFYLPLVEETWRTDTVRG